jgi:hypothetical protein
MVFLKILNLKTAKKKLKFSKNIEKCQYEKETFLNQHIYTIPLIKCSKPKST